MTTRETIIDALGSGVVAPASFPANIVDLFPRFDGEPIASLVPTDPVGSVAALTALAVELTDLLGVHAGVVSNFEGAIVIPGVSGLGKSTLTAALVRNGFGYVSDEVLALDRTSLRYTAFPRPITVDANSLDVLRIPTDVPHGQDEVALDPRRLGTIGPAQGPVVAIVLAHREPGRSTTLTREAGTADAAAAVLASCFNHYRWPTETLRVVGSVVRSADVVRITYEDAMDASARLAAYFGTASPVSGDPAHGRTCEQPLTESLYAPE